MPDLWYLYDVKCNFHTLYIILHESDLQNGVTNQYHLSINSVGLAHEHDKYGAHSQISERKPIDIGY